jgi:UPF0271 protein
MKSCDLNCDLGEGKGNDAAIIPFITSANIACGYHAGDENTMRETVLLAKRHGVAVGAHPSFPDRQNFGRTEQETSAQMVYELVAQQLNIMQKILLDLDVTLHHVKPHGALYNMAARTPVLARAIANAVYDFNPALVLYGLSGSASIFEAETRGLKTGSEVFADRTYQDDASLTPRKQADALIADEQVGLKQVLQMVQTGCVMSTSGKRVPIVAETICLHGDGANAAAFAKAIYHQLKAAGISIIAV